ITVTIGGLLAGIAGASLSIALSASFQGNLTAGKGFIVVALVYFGAWRPYWVLAGAMLFSCVNALVLQIERVQNSYYLILVLFTLHIPSEFVKMSPYVATIIALVFASRRVEQPTALTKAFERGE